MVQDTPKKPSNKSEDQPQASQNNGGSQDEFPKDHGAIREDNPSPLVKALRERMKARQEGRKTE
jgi:hypothetical protein